MLLRYAVRGCGLVVLTLALAACAGGQPATPANTNAVSPTSAIVLSTPSLRESQASVCDRATTLAQTEGPYYKAGSPERSSLIETDTVGEPLILTGRVLTPACEPIPGAVVDVWQADGQGEYDNAGYGLRGRVTTDGEGRYTIETVVPGVYPGRTPHIHVKVFAPDGGEWLTSQIYLRGLSEQIPDGIFDEALLAEDLPPDAEGRRRIGFDIVVGE